MSLSAKHALAPVRVAAPQPAAARRAPTAARASASADAGRRSALLSLVAGVAALSAAAPAALAKALKNPAQESYFLQQNSSKSSQEGYNLEGTKKTGSTYKSKAKLLGKLREEAEKSTAKTVVASK